MKPSLLFCSSLLLLGMASCHSGNGATSADSTATHTADSATPPSNASAMSDDATAKDTATSSLPPADARFLKDAATGGMMEVQLGKIAGENASRGTVKAFGALMVTDHSMGDEKLKALAASKNYPLPDSLTDKQARERDRLQQKMGNDFDKDYVKMMVEDHKDDIKDFEKEAADGKDPDVRTFAENTLKMLHHHLDRVQAIEQAMK